MSCYKTHCCDKRKNACVCGVNVCTSPVKVASQYAEYGNPLYAQAGPLIAGVPIYGKNSLGGTFKYQYNDDKTDLEIFDLSQTEAVNGLGFNNPKINSTIKTLLNSSVSAKFDNTNQNPFVAELAERLVKRMPGRLKDNSRVIFWNSGSEAVEISLLVARFAGGPGSAIIACNNSHNGHLIGTYSINQGQSKGAGPYIGEFQSAGAPNEPTLEYSVPFGASTPTDVANLVDAIRNGTIPGQNATRRVAAVVVEPIQDVGAGSLPAPPGMLPELRAVCDEKGILLIYDEYHCGSGRTGFLTAAQAFSFDANGDPADATPDILVMGGSLFGGQFPLTAVVMNKTAILDQRKTSTFFPGGGVPAGLPLPYDLLAFGNCQTSIATTFGGGHIAGAVGLCALKEIERLLPHIKDVGEYLRSELEKVQADFNGLIDKIQGKGLLQGVVFKGPTGVASTNAIQAFRGLTTYSLQSFGDKILCPGGPFGDDFTNGCKDLILDGITTGLAYSSVDNLVPLNFDVLRLAPTYYTTKEQVDCIISTLRSVLTNINDVVPNTPAPGPEFCDALKTTLVPAP